MYASAFFIEYFFYVDDILSPEISLEKLMVYLFWLCRPNGCIMKNKGDDNKLNILMLFFRSSKKKKKQYLIKFKVYLR